MALIISTAAHVASGRCKIFLSYDSISAIFSDLIWLEALIASCVMCRFEFGILPAHIWSLRQFQIIWFREFESDRKLESLQWYSIHWKRGGNYVEIETHFSLSELQPHSIASSLQRTNYASANILSAEYFQDHIQYCIQDCFNIASKNVLKIAWDHLWHLVAGTLVLVCCHWTWKAAC